MLSSTQVTIVTRAMEAFTEKVRVDMGFSGPGCVVINGNNANGVAYGRETGVRVRSAIIESGLSFPSRRSVVISFPTETCDGSHDLPAALALLACDEQIPATLADVAVVGELSLSGDLRSVRGVAPRLRAARERGVTKAIVPSQNGAEAARVSGIDVYVATSLLEVVWAAREGLDALSRPVIEDLVRREGLSLDDVKGLSGPKAQLERAAREGGNILLVGPVASGKTMLARRFTSLLPPMTEQECVEVTDIYSVAGLLHREGWIDERPFRAPHHTISDVGLTGGVFPVPRPGELSLAHRGVLFLDEMVEFRRHVLEVLHAPARSGVVSLYRSHREWVFPSHVTLIGSINACPCGWKGSLSRKCQCSPGMLERWELRVQGIMPLFDTVIDVPDWRGTV